MGPEPRESLPLAKGIGGRQPGDNFLEIYYIIPVYRQSGDKEVNLPGLTTGRGFPKTFFDCGGQGCRIISDFTHG
jgi:hypothetical protein